jgi:glycosyltransferase involved in cell wall biosynthesis
MNNSPKVLFYNWARAFDTAKPGGGVAVYQDNCILSFLERGWQVHSLSAGTAYDASGGKPYITKIEKGPKSHLAFALVNSPVPAPAGISFFTNQVTAGGPVDGKIAGTLLAFIETSGPYDVIHFNNLEGLPALVLPILRAMLRETRFVFSLHNYYPLCPQVYLWKNNSKNCDGKDEGRACMSCLGAKAIAEHGMRASDAISGLAISDLIFGRSPQSSRSVIRRAIRKCLGVARINKVVTFWRRHIGGALAFEAENKLQQTELVGYFKERQQHMTRIINESFDVILCVSERVKTIAEGAGLSAEKCKVSYIGSKFYRVPLPVHKPIDGVRLRLAFLGYANKVKGFEFLLGVLEQCPDRLLAKLNLMIAARGIDRNMMDRLSVLARKLDGLNVHNGYAHDRLGELLSDIDLGLVPVVWEDCLPQVAIEFVCNGVPIAVSNLGGAREIASNPDFEFSVDKNDKLIELLETFANNKQKLSEFWNREPLLRSMDAHITELLTHYGAS